MEQNAVGLVIIIIMQEFMYVVLPNWLATPKKNNIKLLYVYIYMYIHTRHPQ